VNILDVNNKLQNEVRLWRNKNNIRRCMLSSHIISREEHKKWLAMLAQKSNSNTWIVFSDNIPIGLVNLRDMDRKKLSADWGFYIGEDSWRGRGLGKRILVKLLQMFFEEMKYNLLKTDIIANNIQASNLYKKFGFKMNGERILPDGRKAFNMVFSRAEWNMVRNRSTE